MKFLQRKNKDISLIDSAISNAKYNILILDSQILDRLLYKESDLKTIKLLKDTRDSFRTQIELLEGFKYGRK